VDEIERIPCNMTKDQFLKKFVLRREPVMLTGCQEGWSATQWTLKGISLIKFKTITE
jgi:hypothetical protein